MYIAQPAWHLELVIGEILPWSVLEWQGPIDCQPTNETCQISPRKNLPLLLHNYQIKTKFIIELAIKYNYKLSSNIFYFHIAHIHIFNKQFLNHQDENWLQPQTSNYWECWLVHFTFKRIQYLLFQINYYYHQYHTKINCHFINSII